MPVAIAAKAVAMTPSTKSLNFTIISVAGIEDTNSDIVTASSLVAGSVALSRKERKFRDSSGFDLFLVALKGINLNFYCSNS